MFFRIILKIWLVSKLWFSSGNLTVWTKAVKFWFRFFNKLMHKQWRTVGVALTLINFNLSKKYLWIDSLSQSWTNPMHLLWAFGSLTLFQSCLPLVCLWDCKFVFVPKFMYGYLRTCSCDVFPQSRWLTDARFLFRIWSENVVIQYQDLWLMITLCGYGAPWVTFYQLCWKIWLIASLCYIDA